MLVEASPYGPDASGSRLSNSTTALLLASRPVTTLRMSDAMAVEQVSASAAAGQNVIFSIDFLPCMWRLPRIERNDEPFDNGRRVPREEYPWRPITSISGSPWGAPILTSAR